MSVIQGGNREKHFPIDKSKASVSIIIVTYNAEKFVQQCIDSITAQRFQNFELIIFDGASKDNTIELIKQNEQHISYWQSEPDNGIYEAMNNALKQASADWFYFLGIDDQLLPTFSNMAEKLTHKNTIYTGNCITDKNDILDGNFSAYRLTKMNISHQAIFYPNAVFKKYHYQLKYRVYADYVLNLQCWGDKAFTKKYFPISIAIYHTGGFSSFLEDELFKNEKDVLIKKYLGLYELMRYRIKQRKDKRKKK